MTLPASADTDVQLTPRMSELLERLAQEDAGLGDPTLLAPEAARALAERTNARWNTDLPDIKSVHEFDLAADDGHRIGCRLLSPENANGLIVFVHGGGWALCSMATHERAARLLAQEAGASVLTFNYRLAPEAPYPRGLHDCWTVWRAVSRGLPMLPVGDQPCALAGDSAGANLALATILHMQATGQPVPAAALLFYGVFDANFETLSYREHENGPGLTRDKMIRYWDWYVGEHDARQSPLISPQQASDAQLRALPPLYLNAAAIDPLRSDTENLVHRLRSLGRTDRYTLYRGVVHGFMQMSLELPEARMAAEEAGRAFRELTGT